MDNTYLTPTPEEQALIEQRDELLAVARQMLEAYGELTDNAEEYRRKDWERVIAKAGGDRNT